MKAIVWRRYGGPEVLRLEDIDMPSPADDQVLVKVHAASVNPADWHRMTGTPYLVRIGGLRAPKQTVLGTDLAGVVERAGAKVTAFRPGDRVFGMRQGSFAEYVAVREDGVAAIPDGVSFEQAGAVPVAALTALQALRTKAGLRAGQSVLVNGASGGVGTFAVQIAKALGAEVIGVCRTHNVEMVRSLGADRVIDYTREDFVHSGRSYDVILDVAGNRSLRDRRRVLAPRGALVVVGGPKKNHWVGPAGAVLLATIAGYLGTRKMTGMMATNNKDDLEFMAHLMKTGKVTPVIERTYPLAQTAQAMRYLGEGHARGKLVLLV
jgi:NADPH:quinone reductase-like Zn-dependent oxidoreductase